MIRVENSNEPSPKASTYHYKYTKKSSKQDKSNLKKPTTVSQAYKRNIQTSDPKSQTGNIKKLTQNIVAMLKDPHNTDKSSKEDMSTQPFITGTSPPHTHRRQIERESNRSYPSLSATNEHLQWLGQLRREHFHERNGRGARDHPPQLSALGRQRHEGPADQDQELGEGQAAAADIPR